MFTRKITFVVIAFILVVPAIEFLSIFSSPSEAFALKSSSTDTQCTKNGVFTSGPDADRCCYFTSYEMDDGSPIGTFEYCADCHNEGGQLVCGDFECVTCKRPLPLGNLPQAEIVPPNRTLPGVSDLPTLEQVPLETGPDFNQGTEREPTLPVVCSEEAGLEKDPETGQCVPIESPVTGEQPEETTEEPVEQQQTDEEQEQPELEEEQPSEESDSGDNGNN